ncbi:hypothetical protein EV426DRAFT_535649 [Tirmania nivea]|nr:hypothetical protein EV426DRAFT_535649 [Tirmania nivea]
MSLFPLTSSSVLDLDEASFHRNSERHSKSPGPKLRNGSYIQHTSAPTTPGILSPTPSTYFTPHESYISDLPKSKSTTQLYGDSHASNVWMHRTGAALSSESREFKGQSWLVSRASSTSLVDDNWAGEDSDDWQARRERSRSRTDAGSRTGSGSRAVSRDHLGQGYALEDESEEVEFEEETDDEEYLYREKGYGLGMWVDRIIGWSLFSVDEDEDEEEYQKDPYGEGRKRKKQPTQPQPLPKVIPVVNTTVVTPASTHQPEEDESWGDPSWMFSIATQVLF